MPVNAVYQALTSDVIVSYSFGESANHVAKKAFNRAFIGNPGKGLEYFHWLIHIGWLYPLIKSLPTVVAVRMSCSLVSIFRLQEVDLSI